MIGGLHAGDVADPQLESVDGGTMFGLSMLQVDRAGAGVEVECPSLLEAFRDEDALAARRQQAEAERRAGHPLADLVVQADPERLPELQLVNRFRAVGGEHFDAGEPRAPFAVAVGGAEIDHRRLAAAAEIVRDHFARRAAARDLAAAEQHGARAERLDRREVWLTKTTVRPLRATSFIRPRQRRWNSASPTDNTSSMSRISGVRCAATAKASRTYIPLE